MLIPGAYEPNAPPHRATRAAHLVAAGPVHDVRPQPAIAAAPYVVAAPVQPTTRIGFAAAILSDIGLIIGIIFAISVVPAIAVLGLETVAAFIMRMFGRH
jgi:hypothetical protein